MVVSSFVGGRSSASKHRRRKKAGFAGAQSWLSPYRARRAHLSASSRGFDQALSVGQ